jgi:hypothetical protein
MAGRTCCEPTLARLLVLAALEDEVVVEVLAEAMDDDGNGEGDEEVAENEDCRTGVVVSGSGEVLTRSSMTFNVREGDGVGAVVVVVVVVVIGTRDAVSAEVDLYFLLGISSTRFGTVTLVNDKWRFETVDAFAAELEEQHSGTTSMDSSLSN